MPALNRIFSKYTGQLRSLRIVYYINNLLNARKLRHNERLYKKYGLEKSIFGSISSRDFQADAEDTPWLDKPDAKEKLVAHPDFKNFDADTQQQLIQWIDRGYLVLKGFYAENEVDELNGEVNRLLKEQKTAFNYTGRKVMDAHQLSGVIDKYFRYERMLNVMNFIMGKKVHPFQTINFIRGSEQRAHSDSIHMTSEPKGYMIASWTALENCHEENGLLFYYPSSHKLPYVMTDDFETGHSRWRLGKNANKRYEDKIEEVIEKYDLKKEYFHAEKGDVLLWHANLIHGGSPIKQVGSTRQSMVCHYFCEDVICYHEISQRPAMLKKK